MLALFHRSPVESTTGLAPMIIHRMPAYNPSPSGALPPAVATVVLKRQGVYIADALVNLTLMIDVFLHRRAVLQVFRNDAVEQLRRDLVVIGHLSQPGIVLRVEGGDDLLVDVIERLDQPRRGRGWPGTVKLPTPTGWGA